MAGNSGATKTAIRTAVAALRDLPPEDTVVMYFSGHGYLDETDRIAYIIPYDGITEDMRFVRENWISPADMVSWFQELATDRIVLILDTCNSGAFADPWNSIDLSPQQFTGTSFPVFPLAAFARFGELVRKLSAPRTGAPPIVIAASGADEESWESPSILYRHGIFTKYLLDSAYNGDRNGDGWVTATEAWHYAAKAILSRWNSGAWTDFMPHITGGARDIVLFSLR